MKIAKNTKAFADMVVQGSEPGTPATFPHISEYREYAEASKHMREAITQLGLLSQKDGVNPAYSEAAREAIANLSVILLDMGTMK